MSITNWFKTGHSLKRPRSEELPGPEENNEGLEIQIRAPETGFTEKTEPRTKRRKRGEYHFYDAQTRLDIAKSSLLIGVNKTARKFSKQLGMRVNESTVRGMKKAYLLKLKKGDKPSTLPKCQGRNVLGEDKAKIIEKE